MKMLRSLARPSTAAAIVILLLGGIPVPAFTQSEPFVVARLVICEDVRERSPVHVTDVFPVDTRKVFCFLEARDIRETTEVTMVWYHEEEEMASVPLTIRQGPRWRTYASKQTMGYKGNWKVYLLDSAGNSRASVQFVLQ